MKLTTIQTILLLIIAGFVIFNVIQSCKEQKPELREIKTAFENNKKEIEKLNTEIWKILEYTRTTGKYYDSLYFANTETIKRFNREINKMDEMFKNNSDSMFVNSVIRYWSNRLYTELPGFFQKPITDTGTTTTR